LAATLFPQALGSASSQNVSTSPCTTLHPRQRAQDASLRVHVLVASLPVPLFARIRVSPKNAPSHVTRRPASRARRRSFTRFFSPHRTGPLHRQWKTLFPRVQGLPVLPCVSRKKTGSTSPPPALSTVSIEAEDPELAPAQAPLPPIAEAGAISACCAHVIPPQTTSAPPTSSSPVAMRWRSSPSDSTHASARPLRVLPPSSDAAVHPSPACVNRKGATRAGEWAASNADDDLGELLPLASFQSQYFDPEQTRCCIPCP
jgi:hypothetical protein